MKQFLIIVALLNCGFSTSPSNSYRELLPIEGILAIRSGYDTNDHVELAVWGYLPNGCYRLSRSEAQVDVQAKKIYVQVESYVRDQKACHDVISPFLEVIKVGFLDAGQYQIESSVNPEVTDFLQVDGSSSSAQDNFLYAPVDQAELIDTESQNANLLQLKGTYPHLIEGCMRIVDVKTQFLPNNVLVVQPIADILKNSLCRKEDVDGHNRFSYKVTLTQGLKNKGLIHVRTPTGRALNQFVNFN